MRWLIVAVGVLAVGCSSVKPLPVIVGDRCFRCQRPIDDLKLAGEAVDEGGHAMKFRTPGCMAKYLADHQGDAYKALFVADYSSGKFIPVERATFAKITINPASLEKDYAAFNSQSAAAEMAKKEGGTPVDWDGVLAAAATP